MNWLGSVLRLAAPGERADWHSYRHRDVLPRDSDYSLPGCVFIFVEYLSDFVHAPAPAGVHLSHKIDVVFGYIFSGHSVDCSGVVSSFFDLVSCIVQRISDEKVVRVDASTNIAFMQNVSVFWNASEVDCVRYPMRSGCHEPVSKRQVHLPIPVHVSAGRPQPAFIWSCFAHLGPKLLNLVWSQRRQCPTIDSSHMISLKDCVVRATSVLNTPAWLV